MSEKSSTKILVVEDEESFLDALSVGLRREGFVVEVARDGAEALEQFEAVNPDLILLDVMLPLVSGLDVCREIRRTSDVPIIMVTARSAEIDTVVGLEVGADDYVTKPYRIRELVARIRAVMRRRSNGAESPAPESFDVHDVLVAGDIELDLDSHEVRVRGESVNLPLREFELLALLMENADRVLERYTLIDRIWGSDYVGDTKTLDVHIKRIRGKVEVDPSNPVRIITVRGVGYRLTSAD
ncbi:MAG TPA: response regulator transcription factor [Microthrixaceae bacterium]|nr:response regulator transcription factor [Microthrixaceae bacterium]